MIHDDGVGRPVASIGLQVIGRAEFIDPHLDGFSELNDPFFFVSSFSSWKTPLSFSVFLVLGIF